MGPLPTNTRLMDLFPKAFHKTSNNYCNVAGSVYACIMFVLRNFIDIQKKIYYFFVTVALVVFCELQTWYRDVGNAGVFLSNL